MDPGVVKVLRKAGRNKIKLCVSQQTQTICITFVQTSAQRLVQHCTNVIHMSCVHWDGCVIFSAVAAEQGNLMATAFHPELTDDHRWHLHFIKQVAAHTGFTTGETNT